MVDAVPSRVNCVNVQEQKAESVVADVSVEGHKGLQITSNLIWKVEDISSEAGLHGASRIVLDAIFPCALTPE